LDGVLIFGAYQGVLQTAIKSFKYRFAYEIGSELADLLADFFVQQAWSLDQTYVTALPVTRQRLAWRGFNQSRILAEQVVLVSGLPLLEDLFIKTQHGLAQAQLSWSARLQLSQDTFRWLGPDLTGRRIIVVDDVMTTGRSLEMAALALKSAGAHQVWGLVLARGDGVA